MRATANSLEQLREFTEVVADTGDFISLQKYRPSDATTNPTLLLQSCSLPEYSDLVDSVLARVNSKNASRQEKLQKLQLATDELAVAFGMKILEIVPGFVSTEVDARLSFNVAETISRAKRIIELYENNGADSSRILIKIAATWEGIQAAAALEKQGIKCNLTLIFDLVQAVVGAQLGVFLISPFVGRVFDWHKKQAHNAQKSGQPNQKPYANDEDPSYTDPGVSLVRNIYTYLRKHDHKTIIMGASFRTVEQVCALAGCDKLTISPALLEQLSLMDTAVLPRLSADGASAADIATFSGGEPEFRMALNGSAMATEKLAEGIRGFIADQQKLEQLVLQRLS